MTYKVGEPFIAKYDNPPLAATRQYKVGQRVDIINVTTKARLAVFVVEETNESQLLPVRNRELGPKPEGLNRVPG